MARDVSVVVEANVTWCCGFNTVVIIDDAGVVVSVVDVPWCLVILVVVEIDVVVL